MRNPSNTVHSYTKYFALFLGLLSPLSCGEEVELGTLISHNSHSLSANSTTTSQILSAAAQRLLASSGPLTIHHDHLGNISLITNNVGLTNTRLTYSPLGALKSGDPSWTSHTFSGQEQDSSTGLLQFKHRHLDTHTGRWTSPDPLFAALKTSLVTKFGESTTSYAYVSHRLMNSFDPTGLGRKGESKRQKSLRKTAEKHAGKQRSTHKQLDRSEATGGGHALRRHLGGEATERARVTAGRRDPERANTAGTFASRDDMDLAVSQVVDENRSAVTSWLKNTDASDNRLAITGPTMGVNATAHQRVAPQLASGGELATADGGFEAHRYPNPEHAATRGARRIDPASLTQATVVLTRNPREKSGFGILTAYPHGE